MKILGGFVKFENPQKTMRNSKVFKKKITNSIVFGKKIRQERNEKLENFQRRK